MYNIVSIMYWILIYGYNEFLLIHNPSDYVFGIHRMHWHHHMNCWRSRLSLVTEIYCGLIFCKKAFRRSRPPNLLGFVADIIFYITVTLRENVLQATESAVHLRPPFINVAPLILFSSHDLASASIFTLIALSIGLNFKKTNRWEAIDF